MEGNQAQISQAEDEEEYVLLDLEDVCVGADIPANAPYVLSGLDTMKPVLVIGDHLKLIGEYQETMGTCYVFSERWIGEYQETMGTCYVFSERDGTPATMCPDTRPSETNHVKDKDSVESKQGPSKQIKPIASLHKIIKFKLLSEDQNEMAEGMTTSIS